MKKEGKPMLCEAHEILVQELDRVKNNQSELYSLDRERREQLSDIQNSITQIREENQNMKNDITELKTDMSSVKADMGTVKQDLASVKTSITKIEANTKKSWEPKDYVAVIVAVLAMAGTVLSAILK